MQPFLYIIASNFFTAMYIAIFTVPWLHGIFIFSGRIIWNCSLRTRWRGILFHAFKCRWKAVDEGYSFAVFFYLLRGGEYMPGMHNWVTALSINKRGVYNMAKCNVCGKDTTFGRKISTSRSHVSGRANRKIKPNLRKVKVIENGTVKSVMVCTRCLRSNKVTRV